MWYLKQKFNPNKHELIPGDFPWLCQEVDPEDDRWDKTENVSLIEESFDISEYILATTVL